MGHFVYKFPSGKDIYLTFDDGPDGKYTSDVLDILHQFSVKSTFFLVGKNVELYPNIVSEIKARGHSVGLHTYSHKRIDTMSKTDYRREITQNQDAIKQVIGEKPLMIRPPQGKVRLTNLMWAIRDRLRIVHFTISSNDWKADSAYDVIKAIRIDQMCGGEIISLHDNKLTTVEALPVLLERFSEAGYCCAPILFDGDVSSPVL